MIKEEFGKTLKQYLKKVKGSKTQKSRESGRSIRFVQEMEVGKKQPSITTIFYLAAGLDLTPDKLIMPAWEKWIEAGQPDEVSKKSKKTETPKKAKKPKKKAAKSKKKTSPK